MSSNSSNSPATTSSQKGLSPVVRTILFCISLPLWVFLCFQLAKSLVELIIGAAILIGIPLHLMNPSLFQAVGSVVLYAIALLLVIGAPLLILKSRTTKKELGINRLPVWMDFVWLIVGILLYLILTSLVSMVAAVVFPFVDYNQVQNTGFQDLNGQTEYLIAFLVLVIIAPVAEELLFRGYLFGKLRKYAKLWVSIIITSLVFAIVHGAWNVGLDVFALSIALCILRVASKSLWPSILLHMLKNGLAFYVLFINPTFISTLGG